MNLSTYPNRPSQMYQSTLRDFITTVTIFVEPVINNFYLLRKICYHMLILAVTGQIFTLSTR